MAKDFSKEPEETEDVFIDAEFNPLNDPINEKPYTKPNVTIDPEELKGDIPEPDFTPPPMGDAFDPFQGIGATPEPKAAKQQRASSTARPTPPAPEPPLNPEMENLPKKDFNKSAKIAAEMIMSGYELLHKIGNDSMQISETKVKKLVREGKLSMSARVPVDDMGNTITVGEFFEEYNDQHKNLLIVDPEWKAEVVPVLTQVLQNKGIGATPEQQLVFLFAKDAGPKVIIAYNSYTQKKQLFKYMEELSEQNKIIIEQNRSMMANGGSYTEPQKPTEPHEAVFVKEDEFDPLKEEVEFTDVDPLDVNYQVNQMTNPDGAGNEPKKRGRKKKDS